MNLWKETSEKLKEHNRAWTDVKWVGCKDFKIPLEDVCDLFNINYSSGYGSQQVASDLMVVGEDFYMTRGEYDGSEWWDWHEMPIEPAEMKKVTGVVNEHLWGSLSDYLK